MLRRDLKVTTTQALLWRRSKLDLKETYNGGHVRADRVTEGNGGMGWRKRERERGVWMEKEMRFGEE